MSVTSKSPLDVLVTTWAVAKRALPAYRHVNSPKKFTQHQLFACLVLKNFQRLDYCDIVEQLLDCPSLLDETVAMQMGRRKRVPDAAIDSTGLEATCASAYFVRRRKTKDSPWKTIVYQRYPKLSLVSDVRSHFILAYRVGNGP